MSLLDDVSIVVTPNGYKAGELYAVVPVPTEGAELVTNGDFATDTDWTKNDWDISNGVATLPTTSTSNLNQAIGLEQYKFYKIVFTVSNTTLGGVRVRLGTSTISSVFTDGTHTIYLEQTTTNDAFRFYADSSGVFNGSIDNVSVEEYASADMDVTRATAGTRVDENGLVNYAEVLGSELAICGDFECASPLTGWTVNSDGAISIDSGKLKVLNVTNRGRSFRTYTGLTIGKTYEAFVGNTSGNITGFCHITSGTANNNITLNAPFFFVAGATTAEFQCGVGSTIVDRFTFFDNISLKQNDRDNVPRIDYTGGGCPHILSEPQRTNNLQSTQDFTDTFWNTNNMETIVASTVLSPDGTTFGYKATPNNTTNKHYVDYDFGFLSMPSGVEVTYSVFAKPNGYTNFQLASSTSFASRYQNFELTGDGVIGTGDVNSAKIEKIGDWYRCSITETTTGTTPRVLNIATPSSGLGRNPTWLGNGTDGVLLWGAQLEEGTYPTSYIPNLSTTSGSTVTRNKDTFTRDGIGSLINSTEGVLFIEMAVLSADTINRYISLSNGTDDNSISFHFRNNSNNQVRVILKSGNSNQFDATYNPSGSTDFAKVAFKYKVNDFALWVNGTEIATDTSGITFSADTLNRLAFDDGNGNSNFYGKVKQLQVYNTALTDAQLTSLTT